VEKEFDVDFFSASLVAVFMKAFSSPPEFSVRIANEMQILVCICPYHSPSAYCTSRTLICLISSENVRRHAGLTKIKYGISMY